MATQAQSTYTLPPPRDSPLPRQFQGDYFGPASSYAAEDFEWSEDGGDEHEEPEGSVDEGESEDEDLDAELQESLRSHWEPARPSPVEPAPYGAPYGDCLKHHTPVTPTGLDAPFSVIRCPSSSLL